MFPNVLVPFDVRFVPKLALQTAAALAHGGSELTLLHIVDVADFVDGAFSPVSEESLERYEAHMNQKIDDVLALLSEYGATATVCTVRNSPIHTVINRVAKALMVDAIVMGTHGRRGLSRAWHGSVTDDVIREADVPVIVIRESSRKPVLPLFMQRQGRL